MPQKDDDTSSKLGFGTRFWAKPEAKLKSNRARDVRIFNLFMVDFCKVFELIHVL